MIVTAGDGGAAGVCAEDGRVAWEYAAPPASPTFPDAAGTVLAPAGRPDPFGDFHLLGGRLLFAQGERRLFALDADSGRVLWTRWAPGARLRQPPPDGRFFHVFPVNADVLLVQTSGGRRWLLDAATGNLLHDDPTASEPWPRVPVRLPDGGICITPDARTVVLLDPASGREVWTYTLPGATTRTGEAPRLTVGPHALLLAWATNIGWRLQRLDPATGKPLWTDPPLVNVGELDVEGWSQDGDAFYGVQDRVLFARSLKDGAVLWQRPLAGPAGRWRTRRVGDACSPTRCRRRAAISIPLAGGCVTMGRMATPAREAGPRLSDRVLRPENGAAGAATEFPGRPQSFARLDCGAACCRCLRWRRGKRPPGASVRRRDGCGGGRKGVGSGGEIGVKIPVRRLSVMAMIMDNEGGDAAERAAEVFGPGHIDHMIRQANQFCW